MKKLLVIGIALFTAMVFAMPATATELKLGGYYFVQGRTQDNPSLNEDTDVGGSHYRMRFRFQPAFIVSDNLRFDMKMDIFDGTSFGAQGPKAKSQASTSNLDIDRLWMTIKMPFGSLAAGRMAGGAWGLTFGDDNEDYDRVRFDTKFGPVSTGIILQKNAEGDWNNPNAVDQDTDTYYAYGLYRADFGAVGLLGAYVNGKSTPTLDFTKYALLPYFDVKFGIVGVRGELIWASGERDPDAVGALTTDIEELAWNLEADVTFGAFKITGGYAWVQGDGNLADTKEKETNLAYGGIGDDWDMFTVMMDVDQLINGHATAAPGTTVQGAAGVKLAYGWFDWKATKTISMGAGVGYAVAEDVGAFPVGTDDKIGTEYGFRANWDIYKNLSLGFRFGYFDAGDFWKNANGITNLDNTYTGYYDLRMKF
jgi:hypothetical protein